MKVIKLKLEAMQPLVITDGTTEGQTHKTLEYIPGNMLLGALASAWKRNNPNVTPDDSDEFNNLFLNSKVKWGHAFPLAGDEQTVPVPLCYQKLKNYGGLPSVGAQNADKSHVLNLSSIELNSDTTLKDLILRDKKEWNLSDNEAIKLKKLDLGFMTQEKKCQPNILQTWNMHVAIGKGRTAADGQLFGFSALGKGTKFISEIYCDDACEQSLKALLNSISNLHIGHSRSAGYGKVATKVLSCEDVVSQKVESNTAKLFLLSGYISKRSWELPLNNLEKELQKYFENAKISKLYCLYDNLNGFNNLWALPRKARQMLVQGSVIEIAFDKVVSQLPKAIGGYINEGYGRILVNPEFLTKPFVDTYDIKEADSRSETASAITNKVVLNLLKTRAIYRIARENAQSFTSNNKIKDFIQSQQNSSKISANQRGNLRNMISSVHQDDWLSKFEDILKKTPGEQWKNAWGLSPFNNGNEEKMSEIMKSFLSPNLFEEKFKLEKKPPKFLEDIASEKDKELLFKEYYRQALLNMLKEWDMKAKRG